MITPSFGLTATERVLPRLALDFTTASLDPRVTFTRTGNTATVVNSLGLVAPINANLPRFDFDPVTLVCRGLLIEEARTNLIPISNNFSDASWSAFGTKTITANSVTSPDGTVNATTLSSPAGNGIQYQNIGISAGTTYTATIFVKATTGTQIRCQLVSSGGTGATYNQLLTISSGTNFGNGWYRLSFSLTTAAGDTLLQIRLLTDPSGNPIYIYGCQIEAGAFATSHIPTTATALTRNADVATMTGTNFSDWYNATTGAFGVTYQTYAPSGSNLNVLFIRGSVSTNRAGIYSDAGTWRYRTNLANMNLSTGIIQNAINNQVFLYGDSDYKFAGNGTAIQTNTGVGALSGINTLEIGFGTDYATGKQVNGWMKQILYWPQRITNNEVVAFSK
jgi:hypothetical protein